MYPPPQLHTGLLGPVNEVFDKIEARIDISSFKKKHNIKGKGIGGDMQGPTIKAIISSDSKLNELENLICQHDNNMILFINHLRNLSRLNDIANSKVLDIDKIKTIIF